MVGFAPLTPFVKIVNPDGTPTRDFILAWQQALDTAKATQTAAAALVVQQAATQEQANAAAETAAAANEVATGATVQERTADAVVNATSATWAQGPTVTFTDAVAVTHVTSEDSGPIYFGYYKAPYMSGSVRLVQIVSAVETVLATAPFNAYADDGTLYWPTFAYDAAEATVGPISYRVDAKTDGGTLTGLSLRTHIVRTP